MLGKELNPQTDIEKKQQKNDTYEFDKIIKNNNNNKAYANHYRMCM